MSSFATYRWLLELYITRPTDKGSYAEIPKILNKYVSSMLFEPAAANGV